MNKTVAELADKNNLSLELVTQTVDAKKNANGWNEINPYKFPNANIVLVKVDKAGNNFQVQYYDEKTTTYLNAVVVPPDFMFKMVDDEKAKALIKKFEAYQLLNVKNTCVFTGNKIGSDPEIFVEDAKGVVIPAFEFLGSKEKPNRVPGYRQDYAFQHPDQDCYGNDLYWDGFQAEFTTHASHCMGWHGDSLQAGLRGIYEAMKKHSKKAVLSIKTVMDIPPKMLQTAKPEHVAFGCNPSLNAYGMRGLEAPGIAIGYRSAGGHVHLGFYTKPSTEDCVNMVKGMDAILGVACVSMHAKYDDPRRRIMYGLAGEYRLPPHGLEYRVLSNAWLFHPVIANIVFDLARTAAMFGKNKLLKHWNATEQETIECINTCDVTKAREILNRNKDLLLALLDVKLASKECAEYSFKAIMGGIESVIKDPEDIVGNWGLTKKWKSHCDAPDKNVHFTVGQGGSGGKKKI